MDGVGTTWAFRGDWLIIGNYVAGHLSYTVKESSCIMPTPQEMSEVEINVNGLICLAEEISK